MIVMVPLRTVLGAAAVLSVACAGFESARRTPRRGSATRIPRSVCWRDRAAATILLGGIAIQLQPGWHTYWRTPGDSGVPPRFDFSKSDNVEAVTVLWPAPRKFEDGAGGTRSAMSSRSCCRCRSWPRMPTNR